MALSIEELNKKGQGLTPLAPGYGARLVAPATKPSVGDVAAAAAPNSTAAITDAANAVGQAASSGQYGAAAGQALRGVAQLGIGAYQDTVGRAVDAASSVIKPAAIGVGNALYTAATGDNTPEFGVPDASAPAAAGARPTPALPGTPAAVAMGARNSTAGPGRGSINPAQLDADTRPDLTGASTPALTGARNGNYGVGVAGADGVRKFITADGRTMYSNVPGSTDNDRLASGKPGVQIAPAAGSMTPGGSFGATPPATAAAPAPGYGAGIGAGDSPELYQARLAAVQRGDIDAVKASYGAQGQNFNDSGLATPTTGNPVLDQINRDVRNGKRITAQGARVYTDAAQAQQAGQTAQANTSIAQQRLGLDTAEAVPKIGVGTEQARSAARLSNLQAQFLAEKDPDKQAALQEQIRVVMGKDKQIADNHAPIRIGTDDQGQPIFGVLDKREGTVTAVPANVANGQMPSGLKVGAVTKNNPDGKYPYQGRTITVQGGKIVAIQ